MKLKLFENSNSTWQLFQLHCEWPKMSDLEQIGGPLDLLQNFVGVEELLTTQGVNGGGLRVPFKFILAFNARKENHLF